MKRAVLVVAVVLGTGLALHAPARAEAASRALPHLHPGEAARIDALAHELADHKAGLTLGRRVGGVALRAYHVR